MPRLRKAITRYLIREVSKRLEKKLAGNPHSKKSRKSKKKR